MITPPVGKTIAYVEFTVPAGEGGRVELDSVTLATAPALAILDQVEGPGGSAENITNANDLETSLAAIIAGLGSGGGGGSSSDSGELSLLVNPGADEEVTFRFKTDTTELENLKLQSGGVDLFYTVNDRPGRRRHDHGDQGRRR